jgi:hypothetical protein
MQGRRDSSSTIWRTVVFAGAMLGCGGPSKPAGTTPQNTAPTTSPAPTPQNAVTPATNPDTANATPAKPTVGPDGKDPCDGVIVPPQQPQPNPDPADDPQPVSKKRPRGGGDRPVGRGFVLA